MRYKTDLDDLRNFDFQLLLRADDPLSLLFVTENTDIFNILKFYINNPDITINFFMQIISKTEKYIY